MATLREPRHLLPMTGKTYKQGRNEIAFKICGEDTGGAYTLCETVLPPGSGAGLHRHPTYDETLIVRAGNFDFQVAGKDIKVGPGETVFVPRGTPHSFKCTGPETGRQPPSVRPAESSRPSSTKSRRLRSIAAIPRNRLQPWTSGRSRRNTESKCWGEPSWLAIESERYPIRWNRILFLVARGLDPRVHGLPGHPRDEVPGGGNDEKRVSAPDRIVPQVLSISRRS